MGESLSTRAAVDLVWFGEEPGPAWPPGQVFCVDPNPASVLSLVESRLPATSADAWLFWDPGLGAPDPAVVARAMGLPGDVWHAGPVLGTRGQPWLMDYVLPGWMLNRDAEPGIEATSWRLSLSACLIRTEVLRQVGTVHPGYRSMEGAALELGYRYLRSGVITRHVPWLIPEEVRVSPGAIPLSDQVAFILHRQSARWARWALWRAVASGAVSAWEAAGAWRQALAVGKASVARPYWRKGAGGRPSKPGSLSVVIPTINRYPYLRDVLRRLERQVVPADEIFVIDQTPLADRDVALAEAFPGLPLKVSYREEPGQCSSRNVALQQAAGAYILFLDDDVEFSETLIQDLFATLAETGADVASGRVEEVGASPAPVPACTLRVNDGFPAGVSLVKREALVDSGLFDLAYDRGQRADGDLGMRLYLSGRLLILDHRVSVLHHRAPVGGLRMHGARAVTYDSSRKKVLQRHLPKTSELYYLMRYFSERQIREALWLRALSTFSVRGGWSKKAAKAAMSALLLPETLWEIRKRWKEAARLLTRYPVIPPMPGLPPGSADAHSGTGSEPAREAALRHRVP